MRTSGPQMKKFGRHWRQLFTCPTDEVGIERDDLGETVFNPVFSDREKMVNDPIDGCRGCDFPEGECAGPVEYIPAIAHDPLVAACEEAWVEIERVLDDADMFDEMGTPGPWKVGYADQSGQGPHHYSITTRAYGDDKIMPTGIAWEASTYHPEVDAANAAFLVQAVNAHDPLVAACEAAQNVILTEIQDSAGTAEPEKIAFLQSALPLLDKALKLAKGTTADGS